MTLRATALLIAALFAPNAFAADVVMPLDDLEVIAWETDDQVSIDINNDHRTVDVVWSEEGQAFAVIGWIDDALAVTVNNSQRVTGEDGSLFVNINNSH